MFHLGHAKVAERLSRSYFWPKLRGDTRNVLNDCPECEIEKLGRTKLMDCFARDRTMPRTHVLLWIFRGKAYQPPDTTKH
jgi:hypothetical protein